MEEHPDTGSDVRPAERGVGTDMDTVKIYSSDTGHRARGRPGSGMAAGSRLAELDARCRERISERPWTALGLTTLAALALGVLSGYCARRGARRSRPAHSIVEDTSS